MPKTNRYEQQFFEALREIFVGAKVEGDSGYINLMRIKSRYYEQGVFPHLKADIDASLKPFPDFREELFDKLYTFFSRYFSESGSIYFRYTALHQNVYEKVYTDDRDVMLFWKTHMLYYVKTDRIFTSLRTEIDGMTFFFDASTMTLKRANEKRETVYSFRKLDEDGTLVFDVGYSEKGKSTKVDDILKAVKLAGRKLDDEALSKAFRVFEKQSEVDYFINKNAHAFLEEQFDLWMYQYLFAGQNVWSAERLAQLQTLKAVAQKVIAFIAQFEDELVRVWNKPKFVRNSHYIITLDKITNPELLKTLLTHPNLPAQVDEWSALGMIDAGFDPQCLTEIDVVGEMLHRQYQYLPFDTRHFPDLELELLALFENIDTELNGWLVHSENYQALNTMLPKFENRIQAIYIDPPYNTGGDNFVYNDRFHHGSWVSMMENRFTGAKPFMKPSGTIFVSNDDSEQATLKGCMDIVFGEENFVTQIIWQKKYSPQNDAKYFSDNHDFVTLYAKQKDAWKRNLLPRTEDANARYANPDNDPRGIWKPSGLDVRTYTPEYDYPITTPSGRTVTPPKGRCWAVPRKRLDELIAENRIWFGPDGNSVPSMKRFLSDVQDGMVPLTIWGYQEVGHNQEAKQLLKSVVGNEANFFQTPKPPRLIERCFQIGADKDSVLMDFFAGSGTTAHAVMNLNRADGGKRKYILVEMGAYFDTIILPRVKKVAFCSKWKDGKPVFEKGEGGLSQFVKYYELEQYEDALRRARYAESDLFDNPYQDPYHQYIFQRDQKMLDSLEVDYDANSVHFDPEKVYPDIDLAETLSNLRGKWIKRITRDFVEFEDGEKISLKDPDWRIIKPLVWW
jgi:adenine specific DNA methylase Mod